MSVILSVGTKKKKKKSPKNKIIIPVIFNKPTSKDTLNIRAIIQRKEAKTIERMQKKKEKKVVLTGGIEPPTS